MTRQHFPYFLDDQQLKISKITFYCQPKDKTLIETSTLVMSPIKKWTLDADETGLEKEEVDDILILLKYQISP